MLRTLTLREANNYADRLKQLTSDFFEAATLSDFNIYKIEEELTEYYTISKQIRKVEERVGIAELLFELSIIEYLSNYYSPENKILYYTGGEDIPETQYAIDNYKYYKDEADRIKIEITEKRELNTVELEII